MTFSPETDLNAVQALFIGDSSMLATLDLTSATSIVKAKRIIRRSQWNDLVTAEKRLCCYFRPSRSGAISVVTNEVLQVDCHVPALLDYMAYRAIARAKELLYNKVINNRIYEFDGQLGELPSMTGFVCVGARFTFYAIK